MIPLLSGILAEAILIYLLNNTNLFLLFAHDHSTKIYGSLSFIFLLYTTIRPKVRVPIDLFLLCAHCHSTKIYVHGPLSFILSLAHHHSTKNYVSHWFISYICSRPFDQIISSSFIYFFFSARPFDQSLGSSLISPFFSARPFDQKLRSSLIYFFHLHTIIWQKYMIVFHLFFLCPKPFD